jgi:hypothetical protein
VIKTKQRPFGGVCLLNWFFLDHLLRSMQEADLGATEKLLRQNRSSGWH